MKKIYLYALLCLSFTQLKAQDGVVFKVKYLPNHNYQASIKVGVKLNLTIAGDSSILSKLSSMGITQPVQADAELGMGGNMKTGAMESDKSFPLNIDYKINNISVSASGKQLPIPPKVTEMDIKVTAHVGQDGKFKIDSAMGKKIVDTTEKQMKQMKQMMDLVQKQIQFPDKPMKPGDSFTQGMPMNIPISAGNNMQMNAGVTYKLVSISDGKAYFDMVPNFSMDFKMKEVSVSFSGTGTGKMVYSIKDNFPLSKEGTVNMVIKVNAGKVNVDGTAVITSNYTGTIN